MIVEDADTFYSAVEGEEVVLECEVEGDPPPVISWLLDGSGLQDLHLPELTIQNPGASIGENKVFDWMTRHFYQLGG